MEFHVVIPVLISFAISRNETGVIPFLRRQMGQTEKSWVCSPT